MVDTFLGVDIRPMTEADVPAVAALEAEIFTDAWSEKLYRETLACGRYDCQVLEVTTDREDRERIVAGYFCGQVILDEAEVHRIAVRPELRGKGYGQVLLQDFLNRVQETGVLTVLLEVRAGNVPAIGLYEKNGFSSIGVRRGYYQNPKEDAQILQKCF